MWRDLSVFDFLKRGPKPFPYTDNELVGDLTVGPHEQRLYKAYTKALSKHGPFHKGETSGGLHYIYKDRNPFADEGMKCQNCVFYNSTTSGCYLLGNDYVEADALCKLWLIPDGLLAAGQVFEEGTYEASEPTMALLEPTVVETPTTGVGIEPTTAKHLPPPQTPPEIKTPRAPSDTPAPAPLAATKGGTVPVDRSVTDMKTPTVAQPPARPTPPPKASGGIRHQPRPTPVRQEKPQRQTKKKGHPRPQKGKGKGAKKMSDTAWWM